MKASEVPDPDPARLKLLYISQVDVSRPFTGSAARMQETIGFLCHRHEVHLVYVLTPPGAIGDYVPQQLPPGLATAAAVPRGGFFSKFFNLSLYKAADRLARGRKFDLVITEFGEAGVYGLALRALRGLPFIYMSVNVESRLHLERAPPTLSRRAYAMFLQLVERLSARCASLVTCCSEADAAVFRKWAGRRAVKVLPCGFRASRFNPSAEGCDGPPKLVFVGNLTYEPNREAVQFIVDEVMDKVLERRPDAQFQFIGVHEPGLEKIAPRAEFTGFVEDLSGYLKRARVVLVPVMTGGGMRVKTVEALACGKAVIAAGAGADGIDVERVQRIRLVEREDFAQAILDELEHGTADDGVDFAYLAAHFSTEAVLQGFETDLLAISDRGRGPERRPPAQARRAVMHGTAR